VLNPAARTSGSDTKEPTFGFFDSARLGTDSRYAVTAPSNPAPPDACAIGLPESGRGAPLVGLADRQHELLSRVVFSGFESGGVLQDPVGEDSSFDNKNKLVMPVESSPASAGGLSELEHHRETGLPRAAALRAAMPQADRGEGSLDGVGRP